VPHPPMPVKCLAPPTASRSSEAADHHRPCRSQICSNKMAGGHRQQMPGFQGCDVAGHLSCLYSTTPNTGQVACTHRWASNHQCHGGSALRQQSSSQHVKSTIRVSTWLQHQADSSLLTWQGFQTNYVRRRPWPARSMSHLQVIRHNTSVSSET
jgi:hypothetical protein